MKIFWQSNNDREKYKKSETSWSIRIIKLYNFYLIMYCANKTCATKNKSSEKLAKLILKDKIKIRGSIWLFINYDIF